MAWVEIIEMLNVQFTRIEQPIYPSIKCGKQIQMHVSVLVFVL